MQNTAGVIDPRNARFVPSWDLLMLLALLFTALVTPFEVVFMDEGSHITGLWVLNRIIDLMFLMDMILIFHLAYQETLENGGHWVYNRRLIAMHYFQSWFIIDFLSVLPFWAITFSYSDPFGTAGGGTGNSQFRSLALTRVFKLCRMMKLARVLKASRVIRRALMDIVMGQLELTFAVVKMLKLMGILALWSHWQACLWGLVSSYMDGSPSWITQFDADYESTMGTLPNAGDRYAAALYWSIQTLTGIGYGEMLPVNTTERMLCSLYMMISGCIWTYVIGSVASIATTLDPNSVAYHNTMDQLSYFMRERGLPKPMRYALRDYFANARQVHQISSDSDLLSRMSPLLQGTVALAANRKWLDQVWYFKGLGESRQGREFIASLAKQLVIRAYVSHERLPIGYLYILKRGLCVKLWRFLGTGKVWGEDIILDLAELVDHSQAVALTYLETYTLRRNELDECLGDYPVAYGVVMKAKRKITVQRAILKHLCENVCGRTVRSFATRSAARGFSEVADTLTLEQKVDFLIQQSHSRDDVRGPQARASPIKPAAAASSGHDGPPRVCHLPSDSGNGGATEDCATSLSELRAAVHEMDSRHTLAFEQMAASQQALQLTLVQQLAALTNAVESIAKGNASAMPIQ